MNTGSIQKDVQGQLQNLSELLSMKDAKDYTVVETSLSNFIEYYFKDENV